MIKSLDHEKLNFQGGGVSSIGGTVKIRYKSYKESKKIWFNVKKYNLIQAIHKKNNLYHIILYHIHITVDS